MVIWWWFWWWFLGLIGDLMELPSGKRLHDNPNLPCLMGKLIMSMVIFKSYVKLPEGKGWKTLWWGEMCFWCVHVAKFHDIGGVGVLCAPSLSQNLGIAFATSHVISKQKVHQDPPILSPSIPILSYCCSIMPSVSISFHLLRPAAQRLSTRAPAAAGARPSRACRGRCRWKPNSWHFPPANVEKCRASLWNWHSPRVGGKKGPIEKVCL